MSQEEQPEQDEDRVKDYAVADWNMTLKCAADVKDDKALNTEEKAIKDTLKRLCRKWEGSLERGEAGGEAGYVHWQLHFLLQKKSRKSTFVNLLKTDALKALRVGYITKTSKAGRATFMYCDKIQTALNRYFKDTDPPSIADAPGLIRDMKLDGWQEQFVKMIDDHYKAILADVREVGADRIALLIIDPCGMLGKSRFANWLKAGGKAMRMPWMDKFEDTLAAIMSNPIKYPAYIFDFPKNMSGNRATWAAIEEMGNGVYDKRNRWQSHDWTPCPPVRCVFANEKPSMDVFTQKRWRMYLVHPVTSLLVPWNERLYAAQVRQAAYLAHKEEEDLKLAAAAAGPEEDFDALCKVPKEFKQEVKSEKAYDHEQKVNKTVLTMLRRRRCVQDAKAKVAKIDEAGEMKQEAEEGVEEDDQPKRQKRLTPEEELVVRQRLHLPCASVSLGRRKDPEEDVVESSSPP